VLPGVGIGLVVGSGRGLVGTGLAPGVPIVLTVGKGIRLSSGTGVVVRTGAVVTTGVGLNVPIEVKAGVVDDAGAVVPLGADTPLSINDGAVGLVDESHAAPNTHNVRTNKGVRCIQPA
jgi:hypothetical protein